MKNYVACPDKKLFSYFILFNILYFLILKGKHKFSKIEGNYVNFKLLEPRFILKLQL